MHIKSTHDRKLGRITNALEANALEILKIPNEIRILLLIHHFSSNNWYISHLKNHTNMKSRTKLNTFQEQTSSPKSYC